MEREKVKVLIELSLNVDEANAVIVEFLGDVTTKEKIAFLRGMFDVELFGVCGEEMDDDTIYHVFLDNLMSVS